MRKSRGNNSIIQKSKNILPTLLVLLLMTNFLVPSVIAQETLSIPTEKTNPSADVRKQEDSFSIIEYISDLLGFESGSKAEAENNVSQRTMLVGTDLGNESEPNNTFETADALSGNEIKIRGNIFENGDVDWYSFTANAGDKVFAAVMTSYSASGSVDSQLRIYGTDGTTVLEFDEDDGSLGGTSSSIAGVTIPATGTYYAQVKHFSATNQLRPYEMYLKVQSGTPTAEVEPNDTAATANVLPANGFVSGARSPAAATEQDWYSFTANAGDTIYLGMDLDPERDNVQWNGRLGIGLFGDTNNQILVVDDASVGSAANPLSEAMFMTVKTTGTYYAFVDSATATTGGPTATYNLSVMVVPQTVIGANCTTYTSTDVPQTIGPGAGLVSSTITVPATTAKIASTRVSINATHALMQDMDVQLRSPNSNNNPLFNDIGASATGGQTQMDITLDQYSGAIPPTFTALRPMILKPELAYRLDWFDGENPSGVWTLDIRDDTTNTSGGTLNGWSIEVCEQPAPSGSVIYSENFETNDGGYTHSGTQDEWEYGTPATAATTTTNPVADFLNCNSGTNCWKTDLDNTYNVSSVQDLVSPNIVLPATVSPITLSWAMRYQMESASFDRAYVSVTEVGNPTNTRRVWEWTGATMTAAVGSPAVNTPASAGWGTYNADITDFANKTVQVTFHLDSDNTVNFGGLAIDDVAVRATLIPGTLEFGAATYNANENDPTATITVNRTGGSDGAVTAGYSLTDGSATGGATCTTGVDYINTGGTVSFAAGETSKNITVALCDDTVFEGNETFTATLSNPTGGASIGTQSSTTVTIVDNEIAMPGTLVLGSATYSVGESDGTVTVTVNRTGGTDGAVSVPYTLTDGTATGGATCGGAVDYVNTGGTVMFANGETSKTFTVAICDDATSESNETFNVVLGTATGGATVGTPATAVVTITDNDVSANVVVNPGNGQYVTLKEAFDAINAGTHTGAVTVSINANTTETATASLNASGNGSASYTSVVVRPVGGARTVEGTITGAIVKLNGADNVTIDGRQGGTGTARDLTIRNNSTLAATAAVWLSSLAANAGATNNIIRNLEIASGTGNINANSTFGIIMSGTTISTTSNGADSDNNQFIFNRITSARYGVVTRGVTTDNNLNTIVSDNIIGGNAFGATQIGKTGILMQADTGATVSRNTVQYVGGNFANTTAGADRVGIAIGSDAAGITSTTTITSGDYTVTRNIIHDVVEERTFSAAGIVLGTTRSGAPTNNLVANNFVYNVRSNSTLGDQTVGISVNGGNTDSIVFNSISLTGDVDPAGSSEPTTMFGNGIRINGANAANNANFTVANNSILIDLSSDTATVHFYPITLNNANYSFGTGFLNYNNYYINPANPQLFTGGLAAASGAAATTEFATLANWQGALTPLQDANSIQADPQYVSNTSDLHIATTSPNVNAGTPAGGVTDDIDGQNRVGIPDIGADEPNGTAPIANDVAAVNIITPTPGSTIVTGNSITPQARFRNIGTATQTNVMVSFTITGPGGFNYTDTQTIASIEPNQTVTVTFAATPALTTAGVYTMTAAVTTADGNPANDTVTGTFNALGAFNGTINVGTGQTYTSLTNPGGIFEALNLAGASGNIVINITSDLTGETGAVALNQLAGGATLTIKPSGAARTISGTSATSNGLIVLNGTDNVTIDGSLSGGSDRSLTITNNQTGTSTVIWIRSASTTNGANGNTIQNCIINGANVGTTAQTTAGILAGSGVTIGAAAEAPNNNNTVTNNQIYRVQNSIYNQGNTGFDQNWTITNNEFGSTVETDKNRFRGMLMGNANNFVISGNTVLGVTNFTGTTGALSGIQLAFAVTNGTVTNNRISNVTNLSTTGTGAFGLQLSATPTTNNLIANNFIWGIQAAGSATVASNGHGITVNGAATAGGYKIYHNSVNLNVDQTSGTTAALNITSAVVATGVIDLRNNIFANTQTSGATRFAVFTATGAGVFSTIDYNDYFAQNVGSLGGTVRPTLADWQTATGQDANSKAVDPLFVSPTDLHIQSASPMVNMGVGGLGITTDIDGQTRDAMPDIGADEAAAVVTMPGTLALSSATYTVGEGDGTVTVTFNRTNGTDGAVSVAYTLTDGTATGGAACGGAVDYVNTGGTVNFAAGQASATFTVTICDDAAVEPSETFNVVLGAATGGATVGTPATAVVTITDNDVNTPGSIQFASAVFTGREGSAATITVTRTGGTGSTDTVMYATSNGTAIGGAACTAGVDYISTSGTLTFVPGATSAVFNVTLCPDATFKPGETINLTLSSATGNSTLGTPSTAVLTIVDKARIRNDFDGDGKTDYAVFRGSDNAWYILRSSDGTFQTVIFGAATDIPVQEDYDGDGRTDIAVFRPSNGAWYILESGSGSFRIEFWGAGDDYVVPGDYDGDGKTDLAVWRESNGTWYIKRSTNGTLLAQPFGQSGDRPLIGDFDNDGRTELTVVRAAAGATSPATVYIYNTTTQTFTGTQWGFRSDKFVIGDYDGDGKDDITVFRPSDGYWYVLKSSDNTLLSKQWGAGTDIPLAGDFDGEGTTDFTVWRPANGTFYSLTQSGNILTQPWGQNGDNPLSNAVSF